MNAIRIARCLLALMPALAAAGCGFSTGNVPSNAPLSPERQEFGEPQVEVTGSARTPQQALAGAALSGSGAVPVIMFKSNERYVENVFKTQPSMELCTKMMNDVVKRVRTSESKGPAGYYCVPVQNGQPGRPSVIAEYTS